MALSVSFQCGHTSRLKVTEIAQQDVLVVVHSHVRPQLTLVVKGTVAQLALVDPYLKNNNTKLHDGSKSNLHQFEKSHLIEWSHREIFLKIV